MKLSEPVSTQFPSKATRLRGCIQTNNSTALHVHVHLLIHVSETNMLVQ